MKLYKLYFVLTALLLSLSGCYDLDQYPEDQMSAGTFFKTKEHADQAMMGLYGFMLDDNAFGKQYQDDAYGGIFTVRTNSIVQGTYTVTDGTVSGKFKAMYEGIARANIVLQNVGNCDITDEQKECYKGEARFMRALFYFNLMTYFGGVPIYDETTVVAKDFANMLNPRNSEVECRSFILKDLDFALTQLPEEWDDANKGRATLGAAMALKGKVFLYNKEYSKAAECFEKVVNSGKYALYPDYASLFKPGGDSSNEMIFALQCIGGVGQDYGIPSTLNMGTRSSYGGGFNNFMVKTTFVDSYEWKDGRPFDWEEVIPGFTKSDDIKKETFYCDLSKNGQKVDKYPEAKDKLLEMYDKRDPRMSASIILPYTIYKGWYKNAPNDCEYVVSRKAGVANEKNGFIRINANYEYYLWRKFVAEYDMDGMINNREDTPINFPLIRYADVLLMLAECYNEMDEPDKAVALINQVRARVDMPGLNSGPQWLEARSKQQIFDRIRHERSVELAAEGHSFNDMKRWRLLETLNGPDYGFTGVFYYNHIVRERDYLWPIPQTEIDKNKNLEQNPDW